MPKHQLINLMNYDSHYQIPLFLKYHDLVIPSNKVVAEKRLVFLKNSIAIPHLKLDVATFLIK